MNKLFRGKFFKKSLIFLLSLVIFAFIVLGILTFAFNANDKVVALSGGVDELKSQFRWFRWGLIAAVFATWPYLLDVIQSSKGADPLKIEGLKASRWRYAALIITFDLVVIEGFPFNLLGI